MSLPTLRAKAAGTVAGVLRSIPLWIARPCRSAGPRAGFTLLEMLVAVAIMAVLAGMIPRSFVYARALINRSESWMEARIVAEAVLNGELGGADLRPGVRRGTIDGRSWRASVQRNAILSAGTADPKRALLDVVITVPVSSAETLTVETMRVGLAQ